MSQKLLITNLDEYFYLVEQFKSLFEKIKDFKFEIEFENKEANISYGKEINPKEYPGLINEY